MSSKLTRRRFLAVAVGTGAAMTVPLDLVRITRAVAGAPPGPPTTYYFAAGSHRLATLKALCARIVPTDRDSNGAVASPGAAEALAYVFIDRLLGAFRLPAEVADNPAIYLRGPYSGRDPYPNPDTGQPSGSFPPDSFLSGGQSHYLALSPLQSLSWRALLEGSEQAFKTAPPGVSAAWAKQVTSGQIPGPPDGGLQLIYDQGLDAFDNYSQTLFHTHFAAASPTEQDLMIETAGNVVVGQLPAAPGPARNLFPYLVINTFQGTYGLPEYRQQTANPVWHDIGWDGDTQPLGSSIYDVNLAAAPAGQMSNQGFGDPAVYQPRGYYREYRPVSTLADPSIGGPDLDRSQVASLVEALEERGVVRRTGIRP